MSTALAVEVGRAPIVVLSEVADLVRGVSYPKTDAREEPAPGYVPMLRATNIQNASLVLDSDMVFVAERNVAPDQLLRPGDIVVATSSGSKHLVGKSGQLHANWRGSFGAFCATVRPRTSIHPRYLALFFQAPAFWRQITKKAVGVNINNLRRGDLESLELPLPPLAVQASIVAEVERQLSRLDDAVASLRRIKANLKRYKAAVLKAAVNGCLVLAEAELARQEDRSYESGDQLLQRILQKRRAQATDKGKYKEPAAMSTSPPEPPPGWTWATIEALTKKVSDGVHKKPEYRASGVPFVTVKNLTAGDGISFEQLNYISEEDHREFCKRTHPERGDLLVSKDGTLGVVRLVETDRAFSIFVSIALVKPVLGEMSRYLRVALESSVLQEQMVPKGSGLQHIHLEDLRQDCVPVPPLSEQHRIVAEVDRRLSIVREVEAEVDANLKRAQMLRQRVLAHLFATMN